MQKLFFTVLLVVAVLVTIRLYRQKKPKPQPKPLLKKFCPSKKKLPSLPPTPAEPSAEFEEEHPEITSGDEETLIEE